VLEIKMITTNRNVLSVLLSLLLVMSGPALALSQMAGAAAMDCGSMVMDQVENASPQSDAGSDCTLVPGMPCPSASGLSNCGVSVGLLLSAPTGIIGTGSQPIFGARATNYQDPFLASITPPPQHHS